MEQSSDTEAKVWYVEVNDKPQGPYSTGQIRAGLDAGKITQDTLLYGPGISKWEPIAWHAREFGIESAIKKAPSIPKPTFHRGQLAHEIDFQICGTEMQFVEIELDPGEAVVAEAGSMMYMDQVIHMDAVFGDASRESTGIFDSLVGAGKRLLTGESLFMTVFTNKGQGKRHVAFAAPYPGKIVPLNLAELGNQVICQKDAFLCAAKGVSIDIAFQKRIGVALFGGEGFIMQRLSGDGLAFVHAGGTLLSLTLDHGEQLKVDTGCMVAMEKTVDFDIQYVGNIKSAIFGGEGFFFATLTGPGTVWLQSLPFSRLAGRIFEAMPRGGGKSVGEGSLLGSVGQLFER